MLCLLLSYKSYSQALKTKICNNCSFQEAKALALTTDKPLLECFTIAYGGYPMRRCFTKEKKKVLIGNYTNKQVYAFELLHANQGYSSDSNILVNSISNSSVQGHVNSLLDVMEMYEDITNVSKLIEEATSRDLQQARASRNSDNNCDNTLEAKAVDLAYNPEVWTAWQIEAQRLYDSNPRYAASFKETSFSGLSFSIGTSLGVTGSWVTTDKMPRIEIPVRYNSDVPGAGDGWKVGYNLSLDRGKVRLSLDENQTYFDGIPLSQWRGSTRTTGSSTCLIKKLNEQWDAEVKAAGQGFGGTGDYGKTLPPGDYSYTMGSGSGGGRIASDRCKWIFYDLYGKPMYATYGPCP